MVYATTSVHIPGDERSRQAPGHGYPEHTDIYNTFEHYITTDDKELYEAVKQLENNKDDIPNYAVLRVLGKAFISSEIKINITHEANT